LNRALQWKSNTNVAKNVILFLGDGMGPTTVTAARFYLAQSRGKKIEDTALTWETFPDVALSKVNVVTSLTLPCLNILLVSSVLMWVRAEIHKTK